MMTDEQDYKYPLLQIICSNMSAVIPGGPSNDSNRQISGSAPGSAHSVVLFL